MEPMNVLLILIFAFVSSLTLCVLIKFLLRCSVRRCISNVSMVGKVAIVTGANSGIGYETAKNLAKRGGRVILACRNEFRGTEAKDEIVSETGNFNVVYKQLDLSSLASIKQFAKDILLTEERLDVLVNNAGVYGFGDRFTADGIVEGLQVNHFGPFLLTLLLLPLLMKNRGRIVNVSSIFQYIGRIDFSKINEKAFYNSFWTYANSKLCNVMFTVELARRLAGTGVCVNAVHPGIIYTNLTGNMMVLVKLLFRIWCWICSRSAEEGSQTIVYLCVAKECANVSGKFFIDCTPRHIPWKARNINLCIKLWSFSEQLVGYNNNESNNLKSDVLI